MIPDSIAVQADGKILAGALFYPHRRTVRPYMARLDPVTGVADSFNPNPNGGCLSIAVQPDGKILAGGEFLSIGGQSRHWIARLDPQPAWPIRSTRTPTALSTPFAVQADGKILAGGDFTTLSPNGGAAVTRNRIARLEPNGDVRRHTQ